MKDVALVLSSGGPRGFAYIGAIEELESRGYDITSVAGCSAGSLVGGLYAAGGLQQFKEWLFSLNNMKVLSLMDFSISKSYVVKGDKVINAIREIVPDVKIEDLSIPFTAVATDLYTGEEVIIDKGDLFSAIRASISIPSLFRPFKYKGRTLVDGGLSNTFPLNRVARNGHDIVVGFDVNEVDVDGIKAFLKESEKHRKAKEKAMKESKDMVMELYKNPSMSLIDKVKAIGDESQKGLKNYFLDKDIPSPIEADDNYYTILSRSFSIMNHTIARMAKEFNPPDVLVNLNFDSYGAIADYAKGPELAEKGRELMAKALDEYEARIDTK